MGGGDCYNALQIRFKYLLGFFSIGLPIFTNRDRESRCSQLAVDPTTNEAKAALDLLQSVVLEGRLSEKLAELLDISVRTLWRLRAANKVSSPVRLGGRVKWRGQEIQAWVEKGCPGQSKSSIRDK